MKLYRVTYSTLFCADNDVKDDDLKLEGQKFLTQELKSTKHCDVEIDHVNSKEQIRSKETDMLVWGINEDYRPCDVLDAYPNNDPEWKEFIRLFAKFGEKLKAL